MAGANTSCNGDLVATVERIRRRLEREKSNQAVVDLIRELEAVPMTYDALEATKIGCTVNALRKTAPSTLARLLADTLYRQWKALADEWYASSTTQPQSQTAPAPTLPEAGNGIKMKRSSSSSPPPKVDDDTGTKKRSSSLPPPQQPVDTEQSAGPEADREMGPPPPPTTSVAPIVRKPNILRFRMVTVTEPEKPNQRRVTLIPLAAPDSAPSSNDAMQNDSDNKQQACCPTTTVASHQSTSADNERVDTTGAASLTTVVKPSTALPLNPVASSGACKRKEEAPTDFDEERLAKARARLHEGYEEASAAREKRKTKLIDMTDAPEKARQRPAAHRTVKKQPPVA